MPSFILEGRIMKLGCLGVSAAKLERSQKPAAPNVKTVAFKNCRRSVFTSTSRQLRHFESLPILPLHIFVRFGVFEPFRLRIEIQRSAQPICEVPKLAMHA